MLGCSYWNLYHFPFLHAELANTGVELGFDIFRVDSYVDINEIFINSRNNPLVEEAKPADRENIEETLLRGKCNLSKYC